MDSSEILSIHAEEAVFLLDLRDGQLARPLTTVDALERTERRLRGHLAGLGLDPVPARALLVREARHHRNADVALAWLAVRTRDEPSARAAAPRALAAGLGWFDDPAPAAAWLRDLGVETMILDEALATLGIGRARSATGRWPLVEEISARAAETPSLDFSHLTAHPSFLHLFAIGASGVVGFCDWLVERMRDPAAARAAGAAFHVITGLDLESPLFATRVEESPDDRACDGLPTPDAARVASWWGERTEWTLTTGRLILGRPLDDPRGVLASGPLLARIAAWHVHALHHEGPLPALSAPIHHQTGWGAGTC